MYCVAAGGGHCCWVALSTRRSNRSDQSDTATRLLYTYELLYTIFHQKQHQQLICFGVYGWNNYLEQLLLVQTILYSFLHSSLLYIRCLLSVVGLSSQENSSTTHHPVPKDNSHNFFAATSLHPASSMYLSFVSLIRIWSGESDRDEIEIPRLNIGASSAQTKVLVLH